MTRKEKKTRREMKLKQFTNHLYAVMQQELRSKLDLTKAKTKGEGLRQSLRLKHPSDAPIIDYAHSAAEDKLTRNVDRTLSEAPTSVEG